MKDSKRILIIGFGSIARKHVRILNQNWPSFEIGIYKKGFFLKSDELNLCKRKFTTYQDIAGSYSLCLYYDVIIMLRYTRCFRCEVPAVSVV